MIEGWLLDVHANKDNTGMTAWVVDDDGVLMRAPFHGSRSFTFTHRTPTSTGWSIGLNSPKFVSVFGSLSPT